MDQTELLRSITEAMDALGIAYMIVGSQASIYYGEPRFTQDIDVVADIEAGHVAGLTEWAVQLGLATIWASVQEQAPTREGR